jgi:hypothetical protein
MGFLRVLNAEQSSLSRPIAQKSERALRQLRIYGTQYWERVGEVTRPDRRLVPEKQHQYSPRAC